MTHRLQDFLSLLLGHWRMVADETIRVLGEDHAGLFVHASNDALDIHGAIALAYPEEELLHSLAFADFLALWNDLHWFQVLFRCGNYPLGVSTAARGAGGCGA
jgi:hypothetical protein